MMIAMFFSKRRWCHHRQVKRNRKKNCDFIGFTSSISLIRPLNMIYAFFDGIYSVIFSTLLTTALSEAKKTGEFCI